MGIESGSPVLQSPKNVLVWGSNLALPYLTVQNKSWFLDRTWLFRTSLPNASPGLGIKLGSPVLQCPKQVLVGDRNWFSRTSPPKASPGLGIEPDSPPPHCPKQGVVLASNLALPYLTAQCAFWSGARTWLSCISQPKGSPGLGIEPGSPVSQCPKQVLV